MTVFYKSLAILIFGLHLVCGELYAKEFPFIINQEEDCVFEKVDLHTSLAILALEQYNLTLDIPLRLVFLCQNSQDPARAQKFALMKALNFWVQGPEDNKGEADLFFIRDDILNKGTYNYWLTQLWPHENRHKIQATHNPKLAEMMWLIPGEKQSVYGAFMEAYADWGYSSTKSYKAAERIGTLLSIIEEPLIRLAGEGDVGAFSELRELYDSAIHKKKPAILGKKALPLFDELFLPHSN